MTDKGRIKVTKTGPYIVTGDLPLTVKKIECDEDDFPLNWRTLETLPHKESYTLCRCGHSKNKPFCDGSHVNARFKHEETAGREPYMVNARTYEGPELRLTDKKNLCVGAAFCTRAGNIWNLTTNSDNPDYREIAIQEANDCPSGRLVEWDKKGDAIEPQFKPGIAATINQFGELGPLWVMGGVEIESSSGFLYEIRNRVTLCRCGQSERMPFCDGTHQLEEESEKLQSDREKM